MYKKLALLFGAVFFLVGLMGFVPNTLVGPAGFFETNTAHNFVHLLFGILLAACGMTDEKTASLALVISGAMYLLVGMAGMVATGNAHGAMLFDTIHVNRADNWLHLLLGVILVGAGTARKWMAVSGGSRPEFRLP